MNKFTSSIIAMAISSTAFAKGEPPAPTPEPKPVYSIEQIIQANPTAFGFGYGSSTSRAGATASTGSVTVNPSLDSSLSVITGHDKILHAPPPVHTSAPSSIALCNVTNSWAAGFLLNLISASRTEQTPEKVCVKINLADRAQAACRFKTAAFFTASAYKDIQGEEMPADLYSDLENMDPVQCEATRNPRMKFVILGGDNVIGN